MEQTKRLYETTFIVNAYLDDAQIDQSIARVQEFITNNGGEIVALDKWGRKRFAYPIRKKNNGFYVLIELKATGNLVAQLERFYQLDESILRYLTIQVDKKALKARIVLPPVAVEPASVAPTAEREPLFENDVEIEAGDVEE
jgi:small subunit ribosomal protein S6